MQATKKNYFSIVEFLIEKGAEIHRQEEVRFMLCTKSNKK